MKKLLLLLLCVPLIGLGQETGCISGDCENGHGTHVYDGGKYIGEFKDGKFHGKAVLIGADVDIHYRLMSSLRQEMMNVTNGGFLSQENGFDDYDPFLDSNFLLDEMMIHMKESMNIDWNNVQTKGYYINGKKDGLFQTYSLNNILILESNWKDGMPEGKNQTYYLDGETMSITNYTKGEPSGVWETYYKNGKLRDVSEYINGKIHGIHEGFYINGSLRFKTNYRNGVWHGLWQTFYENKNLKFSGNMKDGKHHGLWKSYYENGQLQGEANLADGIRDGFNKIYYDNGRLNEELNYKTGKLEGIIKIYYKNGQLKYKCKYMIDVEITAPECWDEKGNEIDCDNVTFE